MDWIDDESFRFYSLAYELVGREPLQGLETAAKVVGFDEGESCDCSAAHDGIEVAVRRKPARRRLRRTLPSPFF